ncbi:LutC/YkgG family protein [Thiocapsa sp. UBA6158]|jgi:L-lactate dehydrogenase complex protein LldG|uniref:LutC/YkgG family protein n=1 Tax=Thiocapsa sp. UBA6158 TaxID=1947692 RepID=UPI0025D4C206|nr:LUD domain-containing protein [Thiocapsa sp. UBA6158]
MSSAREDILDAVRRAAGREPLDSPASAALDARIITPVRHLRPAFDEDLTVRFIRKLESRSGTVARVADRAQIPAVVETFRSAHGLAPRAAVGAGLKDLDWPADWTIHYNRAGIEETLSVTPAFAGIAETGTLMLLASPDSPTTHNFVPDNQVVVLETARILRHFEDAWAALRERTGGMPRAVNLVSGPSRTADIEQTIQLGAHGPRRLHVVLVD